jgi:epothilone polyketide synthase D
MMRLTPDAVDRFARWSGDRNPLHVDPEFARQTYFGQPIAHGALAVIGALDAAAASLPDAVAHGSARALDVEFRGAVIAGAEYGVEVTADQAGFEVVVRGTSGLVLTARGRVDGDVPGRETVTWSAAAQAAREPLRAEPRDASVDDLRAGVEIVGVYAPGEADDLPLAGAGPLHARLLALCSYIVGMEAPGLRSLFTGLTLSVFQPHADYRRLCYRARTTRFDPTFRLLETDVEVATCDGTRVAAARLRSYVPFSPAPVPLDRLLGRAEQPTPYLRGKVALVCGASRGLGAEIAAALALAGCEVLATARHQDAGTRDLVGRIAARGGRIEFIEGDVGDPQWCRTTFERIEGRYGRLDVLVLNACAQPTPSRIGSGRGDHASYVQDNLRLVETPLATFSGLLAASGATVACVSSSFVTDPPAGFAPYVAVKQASESLVRTLVRELPPVSAIVLRPPVLRTRWNDTPAGLLGAIPSDWVASHLINRLASDRPAGTVEVLADFAPFADAPDPKPAADPQLAIRIVATFTANPLVSELRARMGEIDIDADVVVGPYAQVVQSLLDPASLLFDTRRGVGVILIRVADWLRELPDERATSPEAAAAHLETVARDVERALAAHRASATADTLVVLCPSEGVTAGAIAASIDRVERELASTVAGLSGVQVLRARDYHARYAVAEDAIRDELRDRLGHIPYRDGYFATLATIITRGIYRKLAGPKKVVVVDCDNTLWRGVVGEVGAEGIEFGDEHRALHQELVRLTAGGMLVCLCSKNEEADVWSVFDSRADCILRREHVVAAKINWERKSDNIRSLAARLNLGLDSFVFIDDNPVECAEVRSACPEVLTIEWPVDGGRAIGLLEHIWEFDIAGATVEDRKRTQLYREEFNRQELQAQAVTFSDFIDNLQLVVDIAPVAADDVRRASQLTLRTNQFNFTTVRREEADLQALVGSGYDIRIVRVHDRFGDYGVVGLVIVDARAASWTVDTFLLSCRVLGRGVEHRILADVGTRAVAAGAPAVALRLERTKRNAPALRFVQSVIGDFPHTDDGRVVECVLPAEAVAAVRFVPAAGSLPEAVEEKDGAPAFSADAASRARRREAQIAFAVSATAPAGQVHAARTDAAHADAVTPDGVAQTVYEVFAAALRVPVDTVRRVDSLERLSCDSMRIVEITVALAERYPTLPATLLFEHRSVSRIVAEIVRLTVAGETGVPSPSASPAIVTTRGEDTGGHDIAVVGLHVRCAGVESADDLWSLISAGRTAVAPVPVDRPFFFRPLEDNRPHWAGLLAEPSRFDAELFGVSPREAEVMDPQLRLFVEVAWGALEDAGCGGDGHDEQTGVFVGVMYADYGVEANLAAKESGSPYRCWEGFSLANRLSQLLGLRGPSIAVDTACSSSATALHLACRALGAGDCRVAIVGGVNLILDADRFASLGRLGILTTRGRCEPFGAEADGTVLGEGAGVVVLRPLADAVARGDRIYGVIKGTGVSTGSGTVGFTAPNPQAQAEAVRRAIAVSGVDPRTVAYVEAHGTGTSLGDPIEVRGLTLAYTDPALRDSSTALAHRCTIGSLKPNIGHLEAGAGVTSLIKVLLQLDRGMLVPSITSASPNPQIPFAQTPFSIQRTLGPWPRTAVAPGKEPPPRRAGLSSFGVGGANVHVVLEEAPPVDGTAGSVDRPLHLLAISARTEDALRRRLTDLRAHVQRRPDVSVADLAFSLNTGRAHFEHRVAFTAATPDDVVAAVERAGSGKRRPERPPKIAFLFTGQGSQYAGMGRALYETQPVFRRAVDECAAILDPQLDRGLLGVLFAAKESEAAALIDQTGYTQPALFAFEYAMAKLWASWGIVPDLVLGHSVGEIAALCVAGGVSLEDGARLIAARARLMQALPRGGAMMSVAAPEAAVAGAIAGLEAMVSIAAVNGPEQVVISGVVDAVTDIGTRLTRDGIRTRPLVVSHAFHSPLMAPMIDEFERAASRIRFTTPKVTFVSGVEGEVVGDAITRAEYWVRQVRDAVRFAAGVKTLEAAGADVYLEVGPHPVLLGMARQCVVDEQERLSWLPSLRRDVDEWQTLLGSAAQLYAIGAPIDLRGFDAPYRRRRVSTPVYPFGGKQYWLRSVSEWVERTAGARAQQGDADARDGGSPQVYDLAWRAAPPVPEHVGPLQESWAVLGEATEAAAVAASLRARGASVRDDRAIGDVDKAVYVCASDEESESADDLYRRTREACLCAQSLVRAAASGRPARLWIVTRGAVAVGANTAVSMPQAALWGFARTIALEHPEIWGGLIDVPRGPDVPIEALTRELLSASGEDQVAVTPAGRYVARLVARNARPALQPTFTDRGTYLVTGGLGALGLHAAQWLVERGARHVVLSSRRSTPDREAEAVIGAMRAAGAQVTVLAADIARATDVDRLVEAIDATEHPLRGIVHAAGVDRAASIDDLSSDELEAVLAPKVRGAALLDERTRGRELDLFVSFSSLAAVLGSAGRAHYAAANAFLEALAMSRRLLGHAATTIAWGPWTGGGMAANGLLQQFERIGNRGLDPAAALRVMDRLIATADGHAIVADIEWETFRAAYEGRGRRPILAEVQSLPAAAGPPPDTAPWVAQLSSVPSTDRAAALTALLRREVADTLGFDDPSSVVSGRRFYDLGMDSLMMADLISRLKKRVGTSCTALVFDHPEIDALARQLLEHLHLSEAVPRTREAIIEPAPVVARTGIDGFVPGVEDEVAAFYAAAWPRRRADLIPARWRWMFAESAERLGVAPQAWLYRDDNRIVGYMGSIPVRLKIDTEERTTGWLVDTMVLESHRSQGIGPRLMVQAHEDLPFALSLGQTAEMREIQFRLGWTQVAPLQIAQLLVRPENVLRGKLPSPAARAASWGLRASTALRQTLRDVPPLDVREVERFDARHDRLWNDVSGDLTCAVVRDASYLNWKYVDQPGQSFVRLEMADAAGVRAVAVWALREADAHYRYRRALLVDLVAPLSNDRLLDAVLRAACATAYRRCADALVCLHIDARLTRALRRCGFRLRQPERYLLVDAASLPPALCERATSAASWFVMQGDSDIDRPW